MQRQVSGAGLDGYERVIVVIDALLARLDEEAGENDPEIQGARDQRITGRRRSRSAAGPDRRGTRGRHRIREACAAEPSAAR